MEKNTPEKKFSTGVISATIWKNSGVSKKTGEATEFKTISLQRRYTDKNGAWQSTNSMRINDLPKAALVIQKAYEYLVLKNTEQASDNSEVEVEEIA